MSNNKWEINLSNEDNVTIEDVKFIFTQAEKRLDDTIKICDSIGNKTYNIVALVVTIIVTLVAYLFSSIEVSNFLDNKIIVAIFALVYCIVICAYLFKNILPKGYHKIGSDPKDLFSDVYFNDTVHEKKRTIYMYMSEIEEYQIRIDDNESTNTDRWCSYANAVGALLLMPFVLALIYFILSVI